MILILVPIGATLYQKEAIGARKTHRGRATPDNYVFKEFLQEWSTEKLFIVLKRT